MRLPRRARQPPLWRACADQRDAFAVKMRLINVFHSRSNIGLDWPDRHIFPAEIHSSRGMGEASLL